MYEILWDSKALGDLKKLDIKIAHKIVDKITSYLARDPLKLGKPLAGPFKGLMRYRFGDYRIIYEVYKKEIIINIIRIGHRKEVYRE